MSEIARLIRQHLRVLDLEGASQTKLALRRHVLEHLLAKADAARIESPEKVRALLSQYADPRNPPLAVAEFVAWLEAEGYLPPRPVGNGSRRDRRLAEAEYHELLGAVPPTERLALRLARELGLDDSDLGRIGPADLVYSLDPAQPPFLLRTWRAPDNLLGEQFIPLLPDLHAELLAHAETCVNCRTPLFPGDTSGHLLTGILLGACRRTGIPRLEVAGLLGRKPPATETDPLLVRPWLPQGHAGHSSHGKVEQLGASSPGWWKTAAGASAAPRPESAAARSSSRKSWASDRTRLRRPISGLAAVSWQKRPSCAARGPPTSDPPQGCRTPPPFRSEPEGNRGGLRVLVEVKHENTKPHRRLHPRPG